jgi:hypothetical protein
MIKRARVTACPTIVFNGGSSTKEEKIILLSVYAGVKLILSAIICFCFRAGPLAFWAALPCHKTAQIIF